MGWSALEVRNGWHAGEPSYGPAQCRLDGFTVTLRGSLAPGTGNLAFVVPPECTPRVAVDWASLGVGPAWESVLARVSINPGGEGYLDFTGVSPSRGVMLTGSYRID